MWLRLVRKTFSTQARMRNYFPLEPILPIDMTTQTTTIYNRKLQSAVQKVKDRLLAKHSKKSKPKDNDSYFKKILETIMIDQEVGLPVGLQFDDFIVNLKMKGHLESEANYIQNLKDLLKKLQMSDAAQLNRLNKKFIVEKTLNNHLAEARQILFNRLKNFTDHDLTQEARKIAEERLEQNLKRFQEISKPDKNSISSINDQFFTQNVTDTDISDDEKLSGSRLNRVSSGNEILGETYEGLVQEGVLRDVRRNYQRNKKSIQLLNEELQKEQNEDNDFAKPLTDSFNTKKKERQDRIDERTPEKSQYQDLLEQDPVDEKVISEARSLNMNIDDEPLYEDIVKHIDYLLTKAPIKVSEEVRKTELNSKKGYQAKGPPEFEDEKDVGVIDSEEFDLELYKELKGEEQFFRHYLDVSSRRRTEQMQKGVEYFQSGLFPLQAENDDRFFELEKFEDDKMSNLQDEKKLSEEKLQDIVHQFNEAGVLVYEGYGKRKSCNCEAKIQKGSGLVKVNGKSLIEYFIHPYFRRICLKPVELSGLSCYIDIDVMVQGGGPHAQSDAICQGIGRSLVAMCPGLKDMFFKLDYTRTDTRKVERKKVGLYKARKKYPYSRR